MGMALFVLGLGIAIVGHIWLLVVAFRESVMWGVLSLLLSPAALIFAILHWADAKVPFLVEVAGTVLFIAGSVMMAPSA